MFSSGLRPCTAAFLSLSGARHRVFPKAEAGDAEWDLAAGGPRTRGDGGRGEQGAAAPWLGQQGQRLPRDEDSWWVNSSEWSHFSVSIFRLSLWWEKIIVDQASYTTIKSISRAPVNKCSKLMSLTRSYRSGLAARNICLKKKKALLGYFCKSSMYLTVKIDVCLLSIKTSVTDKAE